MKRSGFTRVEFVLTVAVAGLLGCVLLPLLPGFAQDNEEARDPRRECQQRLRQISLGIKQYESDYDDQFPLVTGTSDAAGYGWAAVVQPYIRDTQIFQCPSERNPAGKDARRPGYTDYWYNRNLSRVREERLEFIANTLLLGDGDGGYKASNARYAISALPPAWAKTPNSPARRHRDGANYAFADGHVKWLKPQVVKAVAPTASAVTFRPF
jgi:prepilin-type processing-associated H-X9-DG protein